MPDEQVVIATVVEPVPEPEPEREWVKRERTFRGKLVRTVNGFQVAWAALWLLLAKEVPEIYGASVTISLALLVSLINEWAPDRLPKRLADWYNTE